MCLCMSLTFVVNEFPEIDPLLYNKPDRATMRPDCVSACIDHVTYMERQMDRWTDRQTDETKRVVTEALKT